MAKRLAGVTVLEGTKIKWGTVAGIFVGVPAYIYANHVSRMVSMLYAAVEWTVLGPISFVATMLETAFADAQLGIETANLSFTAAVESSGVYAPLFAAVGTALIAFAFYKGIQAGVSVLGS